MNLLREWRGRYPFRKKGERLTVIEIAAKASGKVAHRANPDRCVQRTTDLNEADIAAVAPVEMTPDAEARDLAKGGPPSA